MSELKKTTSQKSLDKKKSPDGRSKGGKSEKGKDDDKKSRSKSVKSSKLSPQAKANKFANLKKDFKKDQKGDSDKKSPQREDIDRKSQEMPMGSVKSGDKSPSPVMNKSLSSSKFKNAKDDATLNVTASQPGLKKTGTQNKMD